MFACLECRNRHLRMELVGCRQRHHIDVRIFNHRPPVTYTTFQARDLGADTANLFKDAARDAYARFKPQAMIVGASCTAELIQDDPGGLAGALDLPCPVIPLDLPSYQRKENFGADETFHQLCRALARPMPRTQTITCNILGATALGFRHRDDVAEVTKLLGLMGITVNVAAPLGSTPADIARMGQAHFNVLLYPETGEGAARWLERTCDQPYTKVVPLGVGATRDFLHEVAALTGLSPQVDESALRLPWWSASVDSTYLTGKRVFIFGDATHVIAAARIAATDDYLEVEDAIAAAAPELILGTQQERHIGKRLGIPCAVISSPVHVQDFPARYSPQMGFEGANVIFDTWIHPLVMGLEEHLLTMFREDFEFHSDAGPSHHGAKADLRDGSEPAVFAEPAGASGGSILVKMNAEGEAGAPVWLAAAERELKKIPFFVRGKARRNTEAYAAEQGVAEISVETLYEAKAHYAR